MTDSIIPPEGSFLSRNRDFRLFLGASLLVDAAVQIEAVTIGWQIYALARETRGVEQSAFLVGMVGLAQFVPLFVLALFAGSTADRRDRRGIILSCLALETLCVLVLLAVAFRPVPSFAVIFAVAAIFGGARAFLSPASSAFVPMLVPRHDMARAISLKSLSWQASVIVGPWFGGLLCAHSAALAYAVTAVLYVGGMAVLLRVPSRGRPEPQAGSRIEQIREGLSYVWGNRIVLGAISLDLFAVLLGGATALLPAFATDVLDVGPTGFGLLRSGPALGAATMALFLARHPLRRHAGPRMFWAVAGFGVATLVFAVSEHLWLSLVALAVLGAADMISVYVRQTLIQVVTPDHMRGRVASVSSVFISGSNELGEFESGVAARVLGPVGAAVFGGLGTIVVTGLWAWLFPELRRADRLDGGPGRTEAPHAHAATAAASQAMD
ncbi:transporter, putative [Rubellimicrobium mesophilum DSM 19309]|uniref:Transporter, putative n=1 Tax=Rubellimicrobium mesophilum DSM 19309 TaxID=442562 RepID=A0A017HU55_9RHOB|nr:MFS transporter [Rubellimicrobium mesophilum]EYD77916.1 transporter, putative [Rubellimicrobium mesophilum DSM 19309]